MSKAIYPGTFDPVTRGHLDIIRRAAALFDSLVIGVGNNPAKTAAFSLRDRATMVRNETRGLANVTIKTFSRLVTDFARREAASLILRGVRTVSDFEYELQMAIANRASGNIETVFMAPSPEFEFISGRLIKEIAAMGGDVSKLVTPAVEKKLKAQTRARRER